MPEIYRKAASAMNEDPLNNVSVEDLLNEAGYEPPKEDSKPLDITQTSEDLINKAQIPEDKSFLERLFQNASPEFSIAPGVGGVGTVAEGTADKAKPQIAKGAAQGVVGIAQMASQFMYDLADGVDNIAHRYGVTENELLTPFKIDWKSKLQSPDDDIGTKLTSELVQYMAPGMGIAKAFKLGMTGAMGANVALDYMLMDPNQDRLANLVTNNFPEMRNVVAIGNSLKYLEHTDKEGKWEGRFKNAVESFMVNLVPALPELGGAFADYLKAQRGVKVMVDAGKSGPKVAAKVTGEGAKVAPDAAKVTGEAAEEIPKILPSYKSPLLDENSKFFGKFRNLGSKTLDEIAPRATEQQWAAEAADILKDETKLNALLDKPFESFTAAEGVAYKRLVTESVNEFTNNASKFDLDDPEQLNMVLDKFLALSGVETASEAAGRVQGQALRGRQVDVAATGTSLKEFESMLVGEARMNYLKDKIRLVGGSEALKKLFTDMSAINTLDDVARVEWMLKIAGEKTLPKMNRALQYAMYNGMLGVKSFATAVTGNIVQTIIGAADEIVKYGVREVRNSDVYRKLNKLPLVSPIVKKEEALRQAAILKGYRDGFINSFAGFGRPELNKFKTTKLNMTPRGLSTKEQMGITPDMNAYWQTFGTFMQGLALNGLPIKLLGKADEFFGGINYHMKISELVSDNLIKRGVPLDQYEQVFRKTLANPPVELHRKAMDYAESMVLAKKAPADSFVGKIVENEYLKTVIPFTNVTYNAAQFAVEHSPFAWMSKSVRNTFSSGTQLEKDEALARIIVGTTAIGTLSMLSSMGEVNGAASSNYRVNQATADSGKEYMPYSIHGVSVERLDTIRPWVDLAHTMAQATKYLSSDRSQELSINLGAAISNFFTSNQLMENISTVADLVSAISNGEVTTAEQAEKFVVNFAGRFTPSVGRESAQLLEQFQSGEAYKRKVAETGEGLRGMSHFLAQIKNQLKADVPWWNQDLPVQRNILGEPQLLPQGLGPDPFPLLQESRGAESEVMQKLRVLAHASEEFPELADSEGFKLNIAMPGAVVRIPEKTTVAGVEGIAIGGVPGMPFEMTSKQQDKYLEYYGNIHKDAAGPTLREQLEIALADESPTWKAITAKQTAREYRDAIQEAHKLFTAARQRANYLIMQDPEFRSDYDKKAEIYLNEEKQFIKHSPMLGQ